MKLDFVCCCQLYSVDQRTNVLSVFGLIEEVGSPTFPFVIPKLSLIAVFEKASDESATPTVSIRVTINEQQVFGQDSNLDFQSLNRIRVLADINGLVVPSPGSLVISLSRDEVTYGSWKIVAKQAGPPVTPEYSSPSDSNR